MLREMCIEVDRLVQRFNGTNGYTNYTTFRRQVGFAALKEFVTQRPSLRSEAMNMLLELTTHPGKYKANCRSTFLAEMFTQTKLLAALPSTQSNDGYPTMNLCLT